MSMQVNQGQVADLEARLADLEARQPTAILRGMIYGLTMSHDPANPDHHIRVSVGKCRSDDDTTDIELTDPRSKHIAGGAWAPGNSQSGLDTGAPQVNTGYHMWVIYNPTTTQADLLFSASATNPTLPAGFTKRRRIGAIMLDATGKPRKFIQTGDMFTYLPAGRVLDLNAVSNAGPNSYIRQIGVPQGKKLWTRFQLTSSGGSTAGMFSGIYDPDHGVPPAFGQATDFAQLRRQNGTGNNADTREIWQWTDANRQIYTASNDTADVITLMVLGWVDERGQFE